jgi:hypothetical protein
MKNENFSKWQDVMFMSSDAENEVNFMFLIFPDLDSADEAMKYLRDWKEINIAISNKQNGVKFYIYKDIGDSYALQTTYTKENNILLNSFLNNQSENSKFALSTCIWDGKLLKFRTTPPPNIVVPRYLYSHNGNFELPNLGGLN